jgi:hypothetical protein
MEGLSIPLATLVPISFYLILIGYAIFVIVLYYHWQNYSLEPKATRLTYLSFFIVSIPLLLIMAGAAFSL